MLEIESVLNLVGSVPSNTRVLEAGVWQAEHIFCTVMISGASIYSLPLGGVPVAFSKPSTVRLPMLCLSSVSTLNGSDGADFTEVGCRSGNGVFSREGTAELSSKAGGSEPGVVGFRRGECL